jgi:hypothetical protein
MFPNPQDSLPLPQRPNLEQYRKRAKELLRAAKSGEEAIIGWARQWVSALVRQSVIKLNRNQPVRAERWIKQVAEYAARELAGKKTPSLGKAQSVIAGSHGFSSWPKLSRHLQALAQSNSAVSQFESAADAIVSGNAAKVRRLLRQNPKLVRARSTREHGATLLHYVSANGVEGYRQKTPKNIVEIATALLDAGAEIDAPCHVYGGDCTTLGLTATSVHPSQAGVMNDLLELLLVRGAQSDTRGSAGHAHTLVYACLANGRLEAARFLAGKGAPVDFVAAAALDDVDRIRKEFKPDGSRKRGATREIVQEAFRYACGYGANRVVEFLLLRGADLTEHSGDGQTATHYAVIFGRLDTLKLLLKHNPPLESTNQYGGTVFGQTLWSAAHGGDPDLYSRIIEALIAAGAKVPERHVTVNPQIDTLLEHYGSRVEPEWWWYGEGPR